MKKPKDLQKISWIEVDKLQANPKELRIHKPKKMDRLKKSIHKTGIFIPVVINNGVIVAGNARYMAAKSLGLNSIPVINASSLSEEELRAYAIADNKDGALHYLFMDWRHAFELLTAGKAYSELKNICVWNKLMPGMGSLYRSQHELIFVFKNGTEKHINHIQLGKFGRNRANVWDHKGVHVTNPENSGDLKFHPKNA